VTNFIPGKLYRVKSQQVEFWLDSYLSPTEPESPRSSHQAAGTVLMFISGNQIIAPGNPDLTYQCWAFLSPDGDLIHAERIMRDAAIFKEHFEGPL